MPMFWDKMSKKIRSNGIELTLIKPNVGIWTPDVRFHDVSELEYIVEVSFYIILYQIKSTICLLFLFCQTIRFNSSNVFFWSRHTVATFKQVKFLFHDYPGDSQQIVIRFGSYAYDKTWLQMGFDPRGGLSFNENFDKSRTFLENPSWEFDNTTTSFDTYESSSRFLNTIYLLGVRRRGSGIVLRLILPITLLCFLGGLTFWADYGERVNTTITLLLAVSALYIVILGNIPLVGYLTSMDEYIFWVRK
jgi:hypothetical protein